MISSIVPLYKRSAGEGSKLLLDCRNPTSKRLVAMCKDLAEHPCGNGDKERLMKAVRCLSCKEVDNGHVTCIYKHIQKDCASCRKTYHYNLAPLRFLSALLHNDGHDGHLVQIAECYQSSVKQSNAEASPNQALNKKNLAVLPYSPHLQYMSC